MSRIGGSACARSVWIGAALIWTVWLVPFHWCASRADDGQQASTAETPSWQRGVSTWNGSSYQPVTTSPEPEITTEPAFEEPVPYSVPVDPKLYTEPLVQLPNSYQPGKPVQAKVDAGIAPSHQTPALPPPRAVDIQTAISADFVGHETRTLTDPPQLTPPAKPTIGEQIENGVTLDEPPLQQETVRWYQYPWRWMTVGWKNHAEFGLDGSSGNAETLALQTGAEFKRKTDAYTLAVDIDYRFANAGDVTTENNGRYNIDYDRMVADSPWSLFGKYGLEWDKFKAFDLRINLNGGVGYHWIRNDRTTFVSRFGAGASREIGAPVDRWIAEAVFGLDGEHQLNDRNKLKAKIDYFPAWEDFEDFRLVTDAAWEILLDDAENLSLKLAVTDRYDSTPQGARPNDFYYSALLLVKF